MKKSNHSYSWEDDEAGNVIATHEQKAILENGRMIA
jgi:hypothetical protein